jgi:hypothetical protein
MWSPTMKLSKNPTMNPMTPPSFVTSGAYDDTRMSASQRRDAEARPQMDDAAVQNREQPEAAVARFDAIAGPHRA